MICFRVHRVTVYVAATTIADARLRLTRPSPPLEPPWYDIYPWQCYDYQNLLIDKIMTGDPEVVAHVLPDDVWINLP